MKSALFALCSIAVLQTDHQGIPLQPLAVKEIPDRRCALQDQTDIVFLAVLKTFGNEGEVIQLLAKSRYCAFFFFRFFTELNRCA